MRYRQARLFGRAHAAVLAVALVAVRAPVGRSSISITARATCHWGFPLTEARYRFWTNSFTPKEFDALVVSRPELQPDPARGSLTVSVLDCDGFSGQGVEVTLDPDPGIKPV